MELGDEKPSEILDQMKSLASKNFTDGVLRALWGATASEQVQLIVSAR